MATRNLETYDRAGRLVGTETVAIPVEETNADTLRARAEQAIDGLRLIKASTGTLTGLQLSNAVRLLATVLLAILRLQLNRLDDTDG